MIRFLFQGDSITDANRDRDDERIGSEVLGYGYPNLFASDFLRNNKGKYEFINRGVSGDRIVDVYSRIKEDIINLEPDVMSILIGVNDIWHEVNDQNGVDTPKFEKIYSMLIEEIKEALPNIKIIILEPFVLYGEGSKRCYDVFRKGVEERADVARRIANKYDLAFVPLLKQFDDAASDGDTKYWTTDGVHPTAAGHQLIKEELVKAFKTI